MIILSHQHPPLPLQAPMAWPPAWGGERGPSDTIPPTLHLKGLKVPTTAFKKSVFLSPAQSNFLSRLAVSEWQAGPRPTVWLLSPPTMLVQSAEVPRPSALPPPPPHKLFLCVFHFVFMVFGTI